MCGAVRYKTRGEPLDSFACHCTACQKKTGSAFAIELFFLNENVEFTGTAPSVFESKSDETGRWLRHEFCPKCGSSIGLTVERRPGQHGVTGGTFDDPNWLELNRHVWTRSAQKWTPIPHGVERYELGSLPPAK